MSPEDLLAAERLVEGLSAEYMDHHGILPVRIAEGRLVVAAWRDPVDPHAIDDLRSSTGYEPLFVAAPEEPARDAMRRIYGTDARTAEALIAGLSDGGGADPETEFALDDLLSQANEAPVIRLVNMLLVEALDARASDVHLEESAAGIAVRYRIDGVLQPAPSPPRHLAAPVVNRLKIMADLDIAERRLPQDGRLRLRLRERDVDVRVSTIPLLHGESVVLRLLDTESGRIGLNELGMSAATHAAFLAAISRPNGIVLATGPTGSGKTTTLYAALDFLRSGSEKILTVEDPVEYELPGVAQVPVNTRVGLTFARALRALLRQDPDILLVGEIRDAETAEIAIHAAMTGHLVLSTLHTNDAPSAITRLLDLGVPDYLVASTVEAVLAQRLVRRLCVACSAVAASTDASGEAVSGDAASDGAASDDDASGDDASGDDASGIRSAAPAARSRHSPETGRPEGGAECDRCRGTGFRGRHGMYELMVVDDALRAAIQRSRDSRDLRKLAIAQGMTPLVDDGARLVEAGVTTADEVRRVIGG